MLNESSLPRLDPPPLQVVHLLLYAAVCSVFLFVATSPGNLGPAIDLRSAADPRYRQIVTAPTAMLDAANATVLILLGYWSCRRIQVWNEPGHWIALWWLWQKISLWCVLQLVTIVRWVAGIDTVDELIDSWDALQSIYMIRFLPFAILFFCLACGWRGVANTCPWRIYFVSVATWLVAIESIGTLPSDWRDVIRGPIPAWLNQFVIFQFWKISPVLLLLAMLNDLLPNRPRRHWSHWVVACNPLLMRVFGYFPPFVWDILHPRK